MKTYRCSSFPMAMACAGSVNGPEDEIQIDISGEASDTGNATHEYGAEYVMGTAPETLDELISKYNVKDTNRLEFLAAMVRKTWWKYKDYFPKPEVEKEFEAGPFFSGKYKDEIQDELLYGIIGHTDLRSWIPEQHLVRVLDWKTTRLFERLSYEAQMMGYHIGSMKEFPKAKFFQHVISWLSEPSISVSPIYTQQQVIDFIDAFTERVARWDGKHFTAGEQCKYCPRYASCEAHALMIRKSIQELDIAERVEAGLPVPQPVLVRLYQGVQMVEGQCKRARDVIKTAVMQAGGRLKGEDGFDYVLTPVSRDEIDPVRAWPVLLQHMSQDELATAVEIGKTKVLEIVGNKAPKREKGKAKEAVMEELKAAEAVKSVPQEPRGGLKKSETKEA